MDEKQIRREFEQIFEQKSKHAGCLKCNGHGEIAVQDGGKFKSDDSRERPAPNSGGERRHLSPAQLLNKLNGESLLHGYF